MAARTLATAPGRLLSALYSPNAVQFAVSRAIAGESSEIQLDDVLNGIQREYEKEGKLSGNGKNQTQSATLQVGALMQTNARD